MNDNRNRYPYQNFFFPQIPMCYCVPMFYPQNWDMENPQVGGSFYRRPNDYNEVESVTDHGGNPYVINIHEAVMRNRTFRMSLWTGDHLQVTIMNIPVGEDIGLELHPDVDQFLRIESGQGFVQMGNNRNYLNFERYVYADDAIMIPAGTWHNITNTGPTPLKLYSIYAPPEHPFGTVHRTKAEAMDVEGNHNRRFSNR